MVYCLSNHLLNQSRESNLFLLTDHESNSPTLSSNPDSKEPLEDINNDFVGFVGWCTVTEHGPWSWGTRLHPETYGDLSQTGHVPDFDVITYTFLWEIKSIIWEEYKKKQRTKINVCGSNLSYYFGFHMHVLQK